MSLIGFCGRKKFKNRSKIKCSGKMYSIYQIKPLHNIWSQSYKRNLVFKKSKLVLNSLTVCYFNLDDTTVLL